MKTTTLPMHTPANVLVDMSKETSFNLLKQKIQTRMNLLKKVPTGETAEPLEIIADGLQSEVEKARYQHHEPDLQAEFAKIEALGKEFSLTGVYSIERLMAAMQSLVDCIDEQISML